MKVRLLFIFIFCSGILQSQVTKNVVVEHFTNSKCSICASRNPGFYNNLNNHPSIFHIAFHPSSPYSDCQLNHINSTENDDRTKFYGVYGATPRVVINGDVINSSANLSSASLFTPYTGQTSPVSMTVTENRSNQDTIVVDVVIKTEASNSFGSLRLFIALVEDTIAYNAPNGENLHFDVFRRAPVGVIGIQVVLPPTVGGTTTVSPSSTYWGGNPNRVYAIAILQDTTTKEVIQVNAGSPVPAGPLGVKEFEEFDISIYPNPANDFVQIKSDEAINSVRIYDNVGRTHYNFQNIETINSQLNISNLSSGLYFIEILSDRYRTVKKLLIE